MHDLALAIFAAAMAIAAVSMIAASLRLRRIRPEDPSEESGISFAELFARRSIYGLILGAHHRGVGDHRLTSLIYVSRAAMLIAVASGIFWKIMGA